MSVRKRKGKIILALDLDSFERAKYFINKLYPKIKIFKVGLQLFTAAGPKVIEYIRKKGGEAFLDLKFLDIPNTVCSAVKQAVGLKAKMLTVHISGGEEMIKAAVSAGRQESARLKVKRPLLIGVTVLTSQEADPVDVLRLARIGLENGLDGVVCSAREAGVLRKELGQEFIIVTPGIRPNTKSADDQKRTATVAEAIQSGSDYLVIGRPILGAQSPVLAAGEILKAM